MDDTEKFDDKKFTEALQGEDAASAGSFQAVLQGGNGSSGSGKGAAEGIGGYVRGIIFIYEADE